MVKMETERVLSKARGPRGSVATIRFVGGEPYVFGDIKKVNDSTFLVGKEGVLLEVYHERALRNVIDDELKPLNRSRPRRGGGLIGFLKLLVVVCLVVWVGYIAFSVGSGALPV